MKDVAPEKGESGWQHSGIRCVSGFNLTQATFLPGGPRNIYNFFGIFSINARGKLGNDVHERRQPWHWEIAFNFFSLAPTRYCAWGKLHAQLISRHWAKKTRDSFLISTQIQNSNRSESIYPFTGDHASSALLFNDPDTRIARLSTSGLGEPHNVRLELPQRGYPGRVKLSGSLLLIPWNVYARGTSGKGM